MKRALARATVFVVAGAALMLPGTALATQYNGNNAYARYRLPWQAHTAARGLSQGYDSLPTHNGPFQRYSLDFPMPVGTPVLAITDGSACLWTGNPDDNLGFHVAEQSAPADGSGRGGTDYYFYGHNSGSWLPHCGTGQAQVYEGQIVAWSGDSGHVTGPHLHITLQNPGEPCYCGTGTSWPFPLLSGINFTGLVGYNSPQDFFASDNIMAGDDNTLPQPGHFDAIFSAWWGLGGAPTVGVPRDTNGSGPGVHLWGQGIVQDMIAPSDTGIIMQFYGASTAYWVHGAIMDYYFALGGATSYLGYPISNQYTWGEYQRSDFSGGQSICWSSIARAGICAQMTDTDGDGLPDSQETGIYGTNPLVADTDGDGCGDGREVTATFATLDPNDAWDFYSVPIPALFGAPNPTTDFKDALVQGLDAQAVFAYAHAVAKVGTPIYDQDLNQNGIADGVEYDRTVAGTNAQSGPPDGVISGTDAQVAFKQSNLRYDCR